MKARSHQGIKVAFIGLNRTAQGSCANHLSRKLLFKPINMEDALVRFLRTSYGFTKFKKLKFGEKLAFYDAIYGVDPEIFIKHVETRLKKTEADIVIPDVRYLNEMKALQDMGFVICRVTTPVTNLPVGFYANTAKEGSVAVALAYDKRFAVNHNANFSVNWVKKSGTPAIMEAFLERINYKT